MATDAQVDADVLRDLRSRTAEAFRGVHERVFEGDPAANTYLTVDTVEAAMVDGVPTLVLITPWAINGLVFPPGPGPEQLTIAAAPRRAFRGDVPPLGVYWSVNLVADVSRLTNLRQARTLAESFAEPLRDAVRAWLREQA